MANYFELILDTTAPEVHIVVPYIALPTEIIEVDIQANETISSQQVYTIDSQGVRRDYTFYQSAEDKFMGYIDLAGYALGIATIYVTLTDLVDNISEETHTSWLIDNYGRCIISHLTVDEAHSNSHIIESRGVSKITELYLATTVITQNKRGVNAMSLIGNTITITTEFRSAKENVLIDPTDIIFKVYEGDTRECIHTQSIGIDKKVSTGVYAVDYVIVDGKSNQFVIELQGFINTNPVVSRRLLTRNWV